MVKKQDADIPVTSSSGNVFADLGFAEPELMYSRANAMMRCRAKAYFQALAVNPAGALFAGGVARSRGLPMGDRGVAIDRDMWCSRAITPGFIAREKAP
jgi:hypothetical protein